MPVFADHMSPTAKDVKEALDSADFCASCELVGVFTERAHGFVETIGTFLLAGVENIFIAVLPVWFVLALFQLLLGIKRVADIARSLVYIFITYILLTFNGSALVTGLYGLSLEMIGSVGQVTFANFSEGGAMPQWEGSENYVSSGIVNLVYTIESSVQKVFDYGNLMTSKASLFESLALWLNMTLFVILPYVAMTTMFFAKLVIAIFRVVLLSLFAPVIMFFVAFDWGREMGKTALKTLLASVFIAVATTAAMSLVIFIMGELITSLVQVEGGENPKVTEIWPIVFLLMSLAWMGVAFMLDADGVANSLAGSMLSSAGAALMTGAITTTAMLGAKRYGAPTAKGVGRLTGAGMGAASGAVGNWAANQVGGSAAAHLSGAQQKAARIMEIARGPKPRQ